MSREQIHFVTGKLAEHALRSTVSSLAERVGFDYSIQVLPITVAALMTPQWVARHIRVPESTTRVLLPGYCCGNLQPIQDQTPASVECGPRDLRRLPEFFGHERTRGDGYGRYDIEIIAEINHAPTLSQQEVLSQAKQLVADGADVVDLGCIPGSTWSDVASCVRMLKSEGIRVSIDSLLPSEIQPATAAGAELVLSVNTSNREAAVDWGVEVVVIPDDFSTLAGLHETVIYLADRNVPLRIDPILEPIGFGFSTSLIRYWQVRQQYPHAEMMMGIGNLTELTDADSAAINVLLLGICQELGIRSVLTTQVITWAQTSVKECDLARRLVYHSIREKVPPKHLEPDLVLLRDRAPAPHGDQALQRLAQQIQDHNFRIFSERGQVHLVGKQMHLHDADPFVIFDQLMEAVPKHVDPSHAFYLGFEMCKATIAMTLGKEYGQDESLRWGYLTVPEQKRHRLKRSNRRKNKRDPPSAPADSQDHSE